MFLTLAISVSLTQTPSPYRGADLYRDCQLAIRNDDNPRSVSPGELAGATACAAYVRGFADLAREVLDDRICLKDASYMTMIRVYVSYMQKNPKEMDLLPVLGVWAALQEAYPCTAK